MNIDIRKGEARDAAVISAFNTAMAFETEGKRLDAGRARDGVLRLIGEPSLGFYLVAERAGEVVACLMVTSEWSDWRNAQFWWIQSVYVKPEARRQGVFRALYESLKAMAFGDPGVCGLRLYVERENAAAQATYRALGMQEQRYFVFEELRPGVNWFAVP
ncbi:MAG TPA: N-acetyltransferase [Ramlibacter sp.]|uniref:GNAT family N-acetyltransferase n=1 Tax=Ramlibacter sp. TaxID=1917967 RepID=UPI002CC49F01|nr:N-acetyltransferase [Ramlibacter sp.]HVZ44064.1 N-acetyltransferase [Ramlibacter sp.]